MSSRARKPSSKAVEIARSQHSHSPAPAPARKAKPSAKTQKGSKAKSSAKTSNAQQADAADGDNGPAANRLYCICLGTDDGTPMIQCEGCENWYAFSLSSSPRTLLMRSLVLQVPFQVYGHGSTCCRTNSSVLLRDLHGGWRWRDAV